MPGKILGIRSQEILYFIQQLMKVGSNGVGIETMGALISEPVQFPVPLPVQPHRPPQSHDIHSAAVGKRGVRIPCALCTPLADWVDRPQPTTAPPSPLTPFKIATEASADREDKVVQGTESSTHFPSYQSHSRTEHECRAMLGLRSIPHFSIS